MARGEPYAPEDDAILLAHRATADIQRALIEAGRPERTASAIRERKRTLTAKTDVGALAEERTALQDELEALDRRRAYLRDRLIQVTVELTAGAWGIRPSELPPDTVQAIQEMLKPDP